MPLGAFCLCVRVRACEPIGFDAIGRDFQLEYTQHIFVSVVHDVVLSVFGVSFISSFFSTFWDK